MKAISSLYDNVKARSLLQYIQNIFLLATLSICFAEDKILFLSYVIRPSNFLSLITSFHMTYLKNNIHGNSG